MEFTREYTIIHGDEYEMQYTGYKQFDTDIQQLKKE